MEIRWLRECDKPEVLAIENASFENPWSELDFTRCLQQRATVAQVAVAGLRVVGYVVYDLKPTTLHLVSIAVHPDWRGKGVGRELVQKLVDKLSPVKTRITLYVTEGNLDAQLFFRAVGFRAVRVVRGFFDDGQDAYRMVFREEAQVLDTRTT